MAFHVLVIALLIALLAVLGWILILLHRQSAPGIIRLIDEAADRFSRKIQDHAQVNAVLGVLSAMDADPDYRDKLARYSGRVVAAALQGHIDSLSTQLGDVRSRLEISRRISVQHHHDTLLGPDPWAKDIKDLEDTESDLMNRLGLAHRVAKDFAADAQSSTPSS